MHQDDNIISGKIFEDQLESLELLLCRLNEAGLETKGSIFGFIRKKILFNRHVVSSNSVEFYLEKNTVMHMKDPPISKTAGKIRTLRPISGFRKTAEPQ